MILTLTIIQYTKKAMELLNFSIQGWWLGSSPSLYYFAEDSNNFLFSSDIKLGILVRYLDTSEVFPCVQEFADIFISIKNIYYEDSKKKKLRFRIFSENYLKWNNLKIYIIPSNQWASTLPF